jgi:hypothetical protein
VSKFGERTALIEMPIDLLLLRAPLLSLHPILRNPCGHVAETPGESRLLAHKLLERWCCVWKIPNSTVQRPE